MRRALAEYEIGGIKTTLPFFREVIEDEDFIAGRIDTGFIPKWQERRKETEIEEEISDLAVIAAALASSSSRAGSIEEQAKVESRPDKWAAAGRYARLAG